MSKYKIGIIGKGFVGSAVAHGFSDGTGYGAEIRIYDNDPLRSTHTLDEVVNESEFIFISVPTPSNDDGSIVKLFCMYFAAFSAFPILS